ncbi:MAG: YgjV family protein [Clostridia bacterium]|nr:YgjV family protein [Clostridia bacterium]
MENRILALITGFIALSFIASAYFMKKKMKYLLCELIAIIFLTLSYFFTVQYFAMIGLFIGLIRTLTFFLYENRNRTAPIILAFVFSFLTLAAYFIIDYGILKTAKPLDVICLIALILNAFIFRIRNLKIVRFTMPVPSSLSIVFNVLTNAAIFATLTYVVELSANLVSVCKYYIFAKKDAGLDRAINCNTEKKEL